MTPPLLSLHQLLHSQRAPEHIVCHEAGRTICWNEFSTRARTLAQALLQTTPQRWLLVNDSSSEFALWFLALLCAGKRVVLPPNALPGTLTQLAGAFDAQAGTYPLPPADTALALPAIDPARAGIDLYTSGSTGQPKRIAKTLRQLESEILTLECLWGPHMGNATILATVPHHHIYGLLFRVLWPLTAGRSFDAVICAHPDTLHQRSTLFGEYVLISSPAHLARLPELMSVGTLPTARMVFSSGGPLLPAAAEAFQTHFGMAPTEVFGSTETGGIAWRRQNEDPWWMPFPGIQVKARSADAPALLHSPFLGDAEPWPLDDALDISQDGRFRLCGRRDRIVKIEEKRISLHDVEARLHEHAWISNAAAILLTQRRQSLGVAIVLSEQGLAAEREGGRTLLNREFRRHLAQHYEAVLLPRYWRYPAQLPFNPQGKLTQAALTELFTHNTDETASA